MLDFFALLDEPRRPWLDANELKQKFLALSADVHPDRIHNRSESEKLAATRRYTDLNAAFQCLREPRERLRHLLVLETGSPPADVQSVAPELMDFFFHVARTCREVDAFLSEKSKAVSPLLQVQMLGRAHAWMEQLDEMRERVAQKRDALLLELQAQNEFWTANAQAPVLARIEEIYRLLSFYDRWLSQIQERSVRLMV